MARFIFLIQSITNVLDHVAYIFRRFWDYSDIIVILRGSFVLKRMWEFCFVASVIKRSIFDVISGKNLHFVPNFWDKNYKI